MKLLIEKSHEVIKTLAPVVILVLALCLFVIDVESYLLIRFLIGSFMLLIGLSVFLLGIDLSMNPIGEYMSKEVATSKSLIKILLLGFFLGFLITVAEPDLLILGSQIESASGNTLSSTLIVYVVSIGVGILVSLGIVRLLMDKMGYNTFMALFYFLFFILAFFVSEEFLAISFDASGATTGALTTPFTLALTYGLAKVKGGKKTEENSFGLVGVMSAGPMLAIMGMAIITRQTHIQGTAEAFAPSPGVWGPILKTFPITTVESLLALLPITLLFFVFNFAKFKIDKKEIVKIVGGLLLTLTGLIIFLTSVHSGFMDMGQVIGKAIASLDQRLLILIGFLLGLIVVLMEPAVHVLGKQIEEVTAGHIPIKLIRMSLSLGVGIAIALSMVRIVIPEVKLWYFLLPGFALAILLSFKSDPVFVGIAFDAGGVASGPMTATFVLAFAQGAASAIPTANVLVDGFGVIAMVAMAPVFSLMLLGTVFKRKGARYPEVEPVLSEPLIDQIDETERHHCILVVINRGFADEVVHQARLSGATGATILHGRGTDLKGSVRVPLFNVEVQPEKEIVMLVTSTAVSNQVATILYSSKELKEVGEIAIFISPTETRAKELLTELE
jgi:nitrogen regulatory protein PII